MLALGLCFLLGSVERREQPLENGDQRQKHLANELYRFDDGENLELQAWVDLRFLHQTLEKTPGGPVRTLKMMFTPPAFDVVSTVLTSCAEMR